MVKDANGVTLAWLYCRDDTQRYSFGVSKLSLDEARRIVQLGIEKGQELRIGQEDIDVVALAMADLQHHRRVAAERPRIDNDLVRIDLAYQRAGDAKKTRPVWSVPAHAASG